VSLDELRAELDAAMASAREQVPATGDLEALAALERELLGKKSVAARAKQTIKELPGGDRKDAGQAVGAYNESVGELVAARRAELQGEAGAESGPLVDLTLGGHGRHRGHLHLVTQVRRELEDIFVGLGYRVAEGPEVEDDWHNFEALNIPPAHQQP
jgi:phenylalanyl-tRNA synthetase alpha chain